MEGKQLIVHFFMAEILIFLVQTIFFWVGKESGFWMFFFFKDFHLSRPIFLVFGPPSDPDG